MKISILATKMISNLLNFSLLINFIFSLTMGYITMKMIPSLIDKFLHAKRFGIDLNKKNKPKIPESFGVVAGCMFLINCFLFMLIPFGQLITQPESFSHNEFVEMLASLLSICCMLLLGFADDVFDLRWRHKLFLPVLASLPLLVVYYINFNSTTVLLPKQFRHILGSTINLGVFYYVYMAMLAVFCTNAINILAGVNGLEVGQSVIIAFSVLILNVIELTKSFSHSHLLSLYYIVPFLAVSIPLLRYNWCPARIFIGDTFCYFAGMLFAVVGILGHFSKTLLLFFIPQIFNFLYSLPQLFHFIPCPRHRLPQLSNDGKLEMSRVEFSHKELPHLGRIFFELFHRFRLIKVIERKGDHITCNNFTLINLMLLIFGPTYEETLTIRLLILQVICSVIAFSIRYPLAACFYDV